MKWIYQERGSGSEQNHEKGEIIFNNGEINYLLKIPLVKYKESREIKILEIELFEPEGGAILGDLKMTTVIVSK